MKAIETKYGRYGGTEVRLQCEVAPTESGVLALNLVERWGMIAGIQDGEDRCGRSKFRLQTPEELVQRAIDTATLMHSEMKKIGMLIDVPLPKKPEEPKEPKL